mgnify:CR=1 FL=1
MNAIQIKNITKSYNDIKALDNVSFSFEFGKIYGFWEETELENLLLSILLQIVFLLIKAIF